MHSIRETGGVDDVKNGTDLLKVKQSFFTERNVQGIYI